MARRLFNLLSALSLAVCLSGAVLWGVTWRGLEQSSSTESFRRDWGFVVRTRYFATGGGALAVGKVEAAYPEPGVIDPPPPYADEVEDFRDISGWLWRGHVPGMLARTGQPPWRSAGVEYAAGGSDGPVPVAGMPGTGMPASGSLRHYHWWLAVPYWLIVLPSVILPACWAPRARRAWRRRVQRRRAEHGLCPACGYDLRTTPDRCPECGASAEPKAARSA